MARKGWEKMVDRISKDSVTGAEWPVSREQAVKLLARQHAGFVREIKKMIAIKRKEIACIDDGLCDRGLDRPLEVHQIMREINTCNDLLAALGTRKKGGR